MKSAEREGEGKTLRNSCGWLAVIAAVPPPPPLLPPPPPFRSFSCVCMCTQV